MAGTRAEAFWGSVEVEGGDILVNLRLVRYARPTPRGTRLCFDGGDTVEVTAHFDTVSRRLYGAFDEEEGGEAGGEQGGGEHGEGEQKDGDTQKENKE
jgi:hypothetical protein